MVNFGVWLVFLHWGWSSGYAMGWDGFLFDSSEWSFLLPPLRLRVAVKV